MRFGVLGPLLVQDGDQDIAVDPADALAAFLRSLGGSSLDVPAQLEERSALYRSLLAGRRVLTLLDNARSAEQVRPLLPGNPGCAAVVTSRNALTGLVVREGAQRLELDLLCLNEAAELLCTLIGGRAKGDPRGTRALAEQCCGLPLALRLAAELVATQPEAQLAELTRHLVDRRCRLDVLNIGEDDPRTAIRTVFSWSYQHLDEAAARAFRLLGLLPGADCDLLAVAALAGVSLERSRHVMATLVRAHLVRRTAAGRYGMHDLLKAYAAEKARDLDDDTTRRAALTRLLEHYQTRPGGDGSG